MLIKILLVVSLATTVYGQTQADCRRMYNYCWDNALKYQAKTGNPVDDRFVNCDDMIKSCYDDAWELEVQERAKRPPRPGVEGVDWFWPSKPYPALRPRPVPVKNQENDHNQGNGQNQDNDLNQDSKVSDNNCLDAHNKLRAKHGVAPLKKGSKKLEKYADKRGKELAKTDIFAHPANSPYGENLFMGNGKSYTCEDAVQAWYNEIKDYNYNNPGFSGTTGRVETEKIN